MNFKKVMAFTIVLIFPFMAYTQIFNAADFYNQFSNYSIAPDNLMLMNHSFVISKINEITKSNSVLDVKIVGTSVEGRSINMVSFGKGETKILLWSQMHGDEPTATAALLAIFNYLSQNFSEPFVQSLYRNLSIHAIIMLNPDGAQKFQRRNAQDIDINRDARLLQSPEGRALKNMKDQINPDFGFNLHDMGGRETVGDTKKILSIALMAPPYNKENEDNDSRNRAKQIALIIKKTLDNFIPGHISRYKADYMPRAFGDSMQDWGVSTVLIESGRAITTDAKFLVRLNFVSLLSAFSAMADGSFENENPAEYDKIPLEGIELFDLLIKDILIFNGEGHPPFRGDIGININHTKKGNDIEINSLIKDLGDLSITAGINEINGKNLIVFPGFVAAGNREDQLNSKYENLITSKIYNENNIKNIEDKDAVFVSAEMIKQLNKFDIQEILPVDHIKKYSSENADILNLKNVGRIKKDLKANLLIFKSENRKEIHLTKLKHIIKNGLIIFEKSN